MRGEWLCCGWNYLRFILGRESGSRLAMEVGDGARYRKYFLGTLGDIEELKSPCDYRGFVG